MLSQRKPHTVSDSTHQLTIPVALGPRSYEIVIVSGRLSRLADSVERWLEQRPHNQRPQAGKALIVTDRNVAQPYAATVSQSLSYAGWNCASIELEPGEQTKSLDVVSQIYDRLVEMPADRQTLIFAVGGGVVGDVAGFVAATYARGLGFVQVPTSLLAHVDSSVGGKVGINHPRGKNLIGAFHQPLGVFIDTSTLDTLPNRDYRSGLAEVIKYGVILDHALFDDLESNIEGLKRRSPDVMRHIIARSCRLKAEIVEQDEQERTGLRVVLNYGHTFAHALEALCGYGELLHGEAVAIGMVYASRLAERRKLIDAETTERQIALLESVGLSTRLPASTNLKTSDVLDRMKLDKKVVAGRLRFVLPKELGHVELFDDIPEDDVRDVLDELSETG